MINSNPEIVKYLAALIVNTKLGQMQPPSLSQKKKGKKFEIVAEDRGREREREEF